jgi:hypothetical protein
MTHPLPDEICEQIRDSIPNLPCDEHGKLLSYDGQRILDGMFEELSEVSNAEMRAAADWQLEKVVAHIITAEWFEDPEWRITQLLKAIRPTTTTTL